MIRMVFSMFRWIGDFIKRCKDIPNGLTSLLSKNYVEWGEECHERRINRAKI